MKPPTVEEAVAWAKASIEAQGVAERVSECGVVEMVAVLLREGREPVLSEPPDWLEAGWVERVAALEGGVDDNVAEDGSDDGVLAGEG